MTEEIHREMEKKREDMLKEFEKQKRKRNNSAG